MEEVVFNNTSSGPWKMNSGEWELNREGVSSPGSSVLKGAEAWCARRMAEGPASVLWAVRAAITNCCRLGG